MVTCSVCGKPIVDQSYVISNRQVRHLYHEGEDQIKEDEYEKIIATLRKQLSFHLREVEEKNKIIKLDIETIKELKLKNLETETLKDTLAETNKDNSDLLLEIQGLKSLQEAASTQTKLEEDKLNKEVASLQESYDNYRVNAQEQITKSEEDIIELRKDKEECNKFRNKIKELGLSE